LCLLLLNFCNKRYHADDDNISANDLITTLNNVRNFDVCEGWRSDNFIVGLTNVPPASWYLPLWNYAVCGQYPGTVPDGATVTLQCTCGLSAYRYLIVQSPLRAMANVCELEVYIQRKCLYEHMGVNLTLTTVVIAGRLTNKNSMSYCY